LDLRVTVRTRKGLPRAIVKNLKSKGKSIGNLSMNGGPVSAFEQPRSTTKRDKGGESMVDVVLTAIHFYKNLVPEDRTLALFKIP